MREANLLFSPESLLRLEGTPTEQGFASVGRVTEINFVLDGLAVPAPGFN